MFIFKRFNSFFLGSEPFDLVLPQDFLAVINDDFAKVLFCKTPYAKKTRKRW